MYYMLVGAMQPQFRRDTFQRLQVSWPKFKAGYDALKATYSVDRYRKNQFAYLSFSSGDMATPDTAMSEVGQDWDQDVWKTKERFDEMLQLTEMYRKAQDAKKNGQPPPPAANVTKR